MTLSADKLNKSYYRERYRSFETAVAALNDKISFHSYLEELHSISNMVGEIEEKLIQRQDHYVCWDLDNILPLDEFLRTAKADKPYYIGGVCKYKY